MIRTIKNTFHLFNALVAGLFYGFPANKLRIIGITGTDGKTTTTHLTHEILTAAEKKTSMISSVYAKVGGKEYDTGFHVTTPNPWFLQKMLKKAVDHGDEYFVLEVTSHGLDQNRVWGIPFEIGIVTNITPEHLDYHQTYEQYAASKIKLLERSKTAVVNREDESYTLIYNLKFKIHELITYGLKRGDNTLKTCKFSTSLPGDYNKSNILAAYSAAKQLGISDSDIRKAVAGFSGIKGRYETQKTPYGFDVIIDFAHTSNGLTRVLSTVRKKTKGRLIHVFGCAGLRDVKKRPIMGEISGRIADISIITEEDYRTEDFDTIVAQIRSGMKRKQHVHVYKFRRDAINFATSIARRGDVVVLTGKGHEKSLCRGTTEYPWSEHEAVKKALKLKSSLRTK
ncbi:UDP-N-acetylmuramoyl-L-alanyl-D-glutamate--2,6-diaminopimelate ligase [Candidatus Roizmanbacteria bacterium]|nr:UDP-N-acetylmuramoyl-L-alanyl-D-glutamate--2,6-diaminopimelate ligase [Candidatus Roizmanbacteria bacterium]